MARRKKGDKINGWINLDKPVGLTSTQAMSKVRRILNAQKAGHAGTLDPLASGILPIALGEATKTIAFAQDRLKTYEFTVTWGQQRDTDDSEGEVIARSDVRPAAAEIEAALPSFTGEIEQIPPRFSALKIDGARAYDLAREGENFELQARTVYIKELQLICLSPENGTPERKGDQIPAFAGMTGEALGMTESHFIMTCGKGTYVRSLARDLGERLGTCGYISALRRTEVGPFTQENAISLEKLEEMGITAREALLPLATALDDVPALAVQEGETAALRNGQVLSFISRPDFARLEQAGLGKHDEALALYKGKPVALVEIEGPKVKPVRVFNL